MTRHVYMFMDDDRRPIGQSSEISIDRDLWPKLYGGLPLTETEKTSICTGTQLYQASSKADGVPPDFFGNPGTLMTVSRAFRDMTDELEPRLHEFLPDDVVWKHSGNSAGEYFRFLCTATVEDPFDYDRTRWQNSTDGGYGREAARKSAYHPKRDPKAEAFVHGGIIGERHLFRAMTPALVKPVLCSQTFADFLKSRKRPGVALKKIQVIEPQVVQGPW
ncbi:MAG: DUF1629 domain-containing protein [Pseudomonadota bacterium]